MTPSRRDHDLALSACATLRRSAEPIDTIGTDAERHYNVLNRVAGSWAACINPGCDRPAFQAALDFAGPALPHVRVGGRP
jgi:hypothetical protein